MTPTTIAAYLLNALVVITLLALLVFALIGLMAMADFARLYDKETEKVEYALIEAMMAWHVHKHGVLPPLPGLISRVMKGGAG